MLAIGNTELEPMILTFIRISRCLPLILVDRDAQFMFPIRFDASSSKLGESDETNGGFVHVRLRMYARPNSKTKTVPQRKMHVDLSVSRNKAVLGVKID